MPNDLEYLKRLLLSRKGIDAAKAEKTLAGVPPAAFAERAVLGGFLEEEDLVQALDGFAKEWEKAGNAAAAESVRFGQAVLREGRFEPVQVWEALHKQGRDRADGKERALSTCLDGLDAATAADIVSRSGRQILACADCGRSEIVRAGAGEGRCPDCSGRLAPAASGAARAPAEPWTADPLAGQVVGGCRLEKKLGAGGMGYVYKALHLALNKPVAIKFLSDTMTNDEARRRFLKEARAAARLDHRNIVAVHDTGIDKGRHYIVMQFVEGESVSSRLKREGALPLGDALKLAIEAARGIAAAHRIEMIHRDIKPDNILVDRNGEVKVADFGLAKDLSNDSGLTVSQQAMGTPHYMSPEQAEDARSVDARADIYSFGATLYAMLAGSPPFTGSTPWAIIFKHKNEPLKDIRELNPGIPEALWEAIRKMMEKEREKRYRSMEEVYDILVQILKAIETESPASLASLPRVLSPVPDLSLDTPGTHIPAAAKKTASRALPAAIVGGAVVLAAGVVAALALGGVFSARKPAGAAGGPAVPGPASFPPGGEGNGTGAKSQPPEPKGSQPGKETKEDAAAREAEAAFQACVAELNPLLLEDRFAKALTRLQEYSVRSKGKAAAEKAGLERRRILNLALTAFERRGGEVEKTLRRDRFEEAAKEAASLAADLQGVRDAWGGDCPDGLARLATDVAQTRETITARRADVAWLEALESRVAGLPAAEAPPVRTRLRELAASASETISARAKALLAKMEGALPGRDAGGDKEKLLEACKKARAAIEEGDADGAMALLEPFVNSADPEVAGLARREKQGASEFSSARGQFLDAEKRARELLKRGTPAAFDEAAAVLEPFSGSSFTFVRNRVQACADEVRAAREALDRKMRSLGCALVPAFSGAVGSEDPINSNPPRNETVPAFYLSVHETTCAEYAEFVADTGHRPPPDWPGGTLPGDRARHPVTSVNAADVQAYLKWRGRKWGLNVRLPTEAEWEVAAGFDGKGMTRYPWGDRFDGGNANLEGGRTAEVGSHPKDRSAAGILDMGGNVAEVCLQGLREEKYSIRGGSCGDRGRERAARVAFRQVADPQGSFPTVGFRVVVEPR